MTVFEMIKYHWKTYPADISLNIEKIAAHFDVLKVRTENLCKTGQNGASEEDFYSD